MPPAPPPPPSGVDILPIDHARQHSELLKVLSHEGRLACLLFLYSGEKTVTAIANGLGLRQSSTSQVLSQLRASGLVRATRNGKSINYALANDDVRQLVKLISRISL